MPKSDDLQRQSGARPKSARKQIQEGEDDFTHDAWNIIPSGINFNAHNADGVFSKDTPVVSKKTRQPGQLQPAVQVSRWRGRRESVIVRL